MGIISPSVAEFYFEKGERTVLLRFVRFFQYISNISYYIQKICNDEMKKHGLKGSHVQYIAALDRYSDGLTASKLCEVCERDKAAVSRALSELEKKGFICRVGDKGLYRIKLTLTEKGKNAASFIKKRAMSAVSYAGKDLSDENRKVFYDNLKLIMDNLSVLSKDGVPME